MLLDTKFTFDPVLQTLTLNQFYDSLELAGYDEFEGNNSPTY